MRLIRLVFVCALLSLVAPVTAMAAERMWVGFQDDPSFRWREDRASMLDEAVTSNAGIVRTTVYWSRIAPFRPASPSNPFDPAYRWDDLDEFVRSAQFRGLETPADDLGHAELGEREQGPELRADEALRHHGVRPRACVALQRTKPGIPVRSVLQRLERAQPRAVPRADVQRQGQARVAVHVREALPSRLRRPEGR